MAKLVAQPLVQFMVLGTLLFSIHLWIGNADSGQQLEVIEITAAEVRGLESSWLARWNRPPTEEEFDALLQKHIREIALYRHAVAMGLDQNDPVIRRMLGQKLQTLTQDLVELSLSPTEEELTSYFEANAETYRLPELITFTHLFFDPDRRGNASLDDAEEMKSQLNASADPTDVLTGLGDPFMLQKYYPRKARSEVAKQLGQGFTESIFELAPGTWHGPVLSGYGVHLVYVHAIEESPLPEYAEAQESVRRDWIEQRRKEIQQEYVESIIAQFEVVIEPAAEASPDLGAAE